MNGQCRHIARGFPRICRCLDSGGTQDKMDQHKKAQQPARNSKPGKPGPVANLQVRS